MNSEIAIIKFENDNSYKVIFKCKRDIVLSSCISPLIKGFGYTYEKGYAIAFLEDGELLFYITPEEFLNE